MGSKTQLGFLAERPVAAALARPPAFPLLHLQHVSKRYGNTMVLSDLSLDVWPGEAVALLGPNGAGKSTTLRIAAGVDQPDGGDVRIAGEVMAPEGVAAKARCAYVSDSPFLYPGLTGREYLALFASVYHAPLGRAITLANSLGLDAALDQLTATYSLGMQHKLALAGALFHEPSVLLLDEPFAGFDACSHERAFAACTDFVRSGHALIFSTHDLILFEKMGTRAVRLADGHLVSYTMSEAVCFLQPRAFLSEGEGDDGHQGHE